MWVWVWSALFMQTPLQWTQLQSRKKNMKTLFESIRDYQFEKVRMEPDKALTEDTRVLTDEDLMRWVGVVSMWA